MRPGNIVKRSAGAVRSSGWKSRAAAVLLVGVISGGAFTSPASAHGTTEHVVTLAGTVHLRDIDDTSADEVCDINVNISDRAQLSSDPQAVLRTNPRCDEVRMKINFTGVLDSGGNVALSGSVRLEEEDCFISCGWDNLGTRNFAGTIGPATTGTISGTFSGSSQGTGNFNLTFANSF
jgi:hypothetical protein